MTRELDSPGSFDFVVPPKVVFGRGRVNVLGQMVRQLGERALLIHGSRRVIDSPAYQSLLDSLTAAKVPYRSLGIHTGEPEVHHVDRLVAQAIEAGVETGDVVVAIGGGSALDLAKAFAAMVTQPRSPESPPTVLDYLEGVGRGLTLVADPLPMVAIPTTAGTGSEATKNAVISCYEPAFKKSLRSERMMPRGVILDSALTESLPRTLTIFTGLDAITQLIESYITRNRRPLAQALALEGMRGTIDALERAVENGADQTARERMTYAAFLSGMALANSGLGLAHGVAAALGVHAKVPHGLACAVMLPVALRVNREVREVEYAALARATGEAHDGTPAAAAADRWVARIERLVRELKVPTRLSALGVTGDQLPAIATGSRGNSMQGNPRDVPDTELFRLLEEML